jgi:protein associated with RNAse G/E
LREYATFRRGDVFVEFYYWERAYNVFQVSAADGTLKAAYANLGLPAELDAARNELRYVDLALDVWVAPTGRRSSCLDEDGSSRRWLRSSRTWPRSPNKGDRS